MPRFSKRLITRMWVYSVSPGQHIFTYTLTFAHYCCSLLFFFIMMMNFHHAASQMRKDFKTARYSLIPVVLLCTSQTRNRAEHFLFIITSSFSSPCLSRVSEVGLWAECRNWSANEEIVFKHGSCPLTQAPLKMAPSWDYFSSYAKFEWILMLLFSGCRWL